MNLSSAYAPVINPRPTREHRTHSMLKFIHYLEVERMLKAVSPWLQDQNAPSASIGTENPSFFCCSVHSSLRTEDTDGLTNPLSSTKPSRFLPKTSLPTLPSSLGLHLISFIVRQLQIKTRAPTGVAPRLTPASLSVVIDPVMSAFAVIEGVWESHCPLSLLKTGNRLCVRVNTNASEILDPRNFQKRPQ